jgi:hypothetical protein
MTRTNVSLLLLLVSSLGCSAVGADEAEDVGVLASTLPKSPTPTSGKCHVSFGGYTIIVAGDYSADGSCCGKAQCTDGCAPGQKYIDVCIDCSADPDVQCENGHLPVARVQGMALADSVMSSTLQP